MNVPILYKYHTFNEHLFELIETNSFYVASLRELNDVFDCKFEFTKSWFDQGFNKKMPRLVNSIEGRELINRALNDESLLDAFYNTPSMKKWTTTGVCSFTIDNTNELLWAYYTKYYGVCLQFNFTKDLDLRNHFHKVEYDDNIPQVSNEMDMIRAGRIKKTMFAFEKEYRILYMSGKDKLPFNKSSLTAIYYGSRVTNDEIQKLNKKIKKGNYQVIFYRMNLKPYRNKFTFEKC
jgi:hypothetical protein